MLSLQADNRTAVYWFCSKLHHLHRIQSVIGDLRTCLCSYILAKTYLVLMWIYGGPSVFTCEPGTRTRPCFVFA